MTSENGGVPVWVMVIGAILSAIIGGGGIAPVLSRWIDRGRKRAESRGNRMVTQVEVAARLNDLSSQMVERLDLAWDKIANMESEIQSLRTDSIEKQAEIDTLRRDLAARDELIAQLRADIESLNGKGDH